MIVFFSERVSWPLKQRATISSYSAMLLSWGAMCSLSALLLVWSFVGLAAAKINGFTVGVPLIYDEKLWIIASLGDRSHHTASRVTADKVYGCWVFPRIKIPIPMCLFIKGCKHTGVILLVSFHTVVCTCRPSEMKWSIIVVLNSHSNKGHTVTLWNCSKPAEMV